MENIRGVLSFTRAVDLGSFTAAARQLGISPAAVSKNVQRLEQQLGTRLLNRTTRQLALTEAGRIYYTECRAAVERLDAASAALNQWRDKPAGRLRVGLPTTFSRYCVMPAVPGFLAKYPDVQLELVLDDHVVDPIRGGVDLGIRSGYFLDSSLVARPLGPQRRLVCGSPGYLAARGTPRVPDDLHGHRCLHLRLTTNGLIRPWTFVVDGERVSYEFASPLVVNESECLTDAALDGVGLAEVPDYLAGNHLGNGRLVQVLAEYLPPPDPREGYFIYYPHRRFLEPKIRVFVDYFVEALLR